MKQRWIILWSLAVWVFFGASSHAAFAGQIIYVDADANGLNDGSSWRDSYKYLQDALADANSDDKPVEIWVAQGTYRPDEDILHPGGTGNQEATFQLINGVAIKGGYAGFGEPDPNERNTDLYITTLSGDLNGDDDQVEDPCELLNELSRFENSIHVVKGSGTNETAVLDGLNISGGNANRSMKDYNFGGGMYNYIGSPTILNCTFKGNSARFVGGGMLNDHSSPVLVDCEFIKNYGGNSGGGVCNREDSNVALINCTFKVNSARGGGGIFNDHSSPILVDCEFIENSGGGVCNVEDSNTTLINCTFIRNFAGSGGGVSSSESDLTLIGCTFSSNVARDGGGICIFYSGKLTVKECTISGNVATGTQIDGGGGICCACGIIATITDSVITGNQTMSYGGGIASLVCAGPPNQVRIDRCTINENIAGRSGGGIYSPYDITEITNSTISGNLAKWGGGISVFYLTTLVNCIFIGNSAENEGGGLYTYSPRCKVTVTNCTFAQNSANYGGGMYNYFGNKPTLNNCTIVDNNSPNGPAIACDSLEHRYPSTVTMLNCIIWNGLNWLWNNDNSTITATYSDAQGGWPGEGNIDSDPCFANVNNGDYHLKSQAGRWDANEGRWTKDEVTSLCIDAGDPASPIGLETFPNGGIINMGAYGGTAKASKSYFGQPVCETIVAGDINGDCIVNLKDFAFIAFHWLEEK